MTRRGHLFVTDEIEVTKGKLTMAVGAKGGKGKTTQKGWNTSDVDEWAIRRTRAAEETMRVRAVKGSGAGIFCDYEVSHPDTDGKKVVHRVELRSLDHPRNTCDCPDFAKNRLGSCKHIERVLAAVRVPQNAPRESPCAEVFMRRDPYVPVFVPGAASDLAAFAPIRHAWTLDNALKDVTAAGVDAVIRGCEKVNAKHPGAVRVSAEVMRLREELVRREALEHAVAAFREQQGADGSWPFLKRKLYPYQQEGACHLAGKGRAMLADEMGLGKTVQAVAAALLLRETVGIRRVLVVLPASLKGEWEEQIAFFSDAAFESVYGLRHERLLCYERTRSFFVIANYEQVIRDWREINDILKPDLVVLDEAQRIKNWKTLTARNLKRLRAPYAFVLTGTPLENRIDELYSLAEFVDPALFGSLFRFNRDYMVFDENGKSVGLKNLAGLHEKASRILLRRRKSAVEDELPGRSTKTYFTPMTNEQKTRYAEHMEVVAKIYQASLRRPLTPSEHERLQLNLGCMRMLCDSCYILDQKIKASPKLDEFEKVLADLFEAEPQRKVIIFSEWTRMLDLVMERLDARGIRYAVHTGRINQRRRREEIRRFKEDPECRVFLASESGGVGLNLQAASVVVNLDLPWNPAKLEQRIARAWRKNQKRDVLVVNMVAEGTIEQRMLTTLSFKQGLADFVLDAMGDAAAFEGRRDEEPKDGRRKRNAFMERLASVMGEGVRTEEKSVGVSAAKPSIPPDERLRATVEAGLPGVRVLKAVYGTKDDPKTIRGVLAVGNAADRAALVREIGETHGVALPEEAVEVVSRENWELLKRLERLGIISFATAGVRTVVERPGAEAADESAKFERLRKERCDGAMTEARRLAKMGELLTTGGFAQEGMAPCRRAIALAAGAAAYSLDDARAEHPVEPITVATLRAARSKLTLAAKDALVLQLAVQDMEIPDAPAQARRFIESCADAQV